MRSRAKVKDTQSPVRQSERAICENTFGIGATVRDGSGHGAECLLPCPILQVQTCYTAHAAKMVANGIADSARIGEKFCEFTVVALCIEPLTLYLL